ncbi:MAG TPA: cytochrome c biogenesis protein CcdA [Blastocatellia bacterium]|nr:cytochrome c biogenesis protein CcdA [Blastocatellia bacterium]
MPKRYLLTLVSLAFLLLAIISTASAQGRSSSVVTVQAQTDSPSVQAGKSFNVVVSVDIKEGFHINSNKPLQDFLQPTQVELSPFTGLTYSAAVYPKPLMEKFAFSPDELSVFAGHVVFKIPVKAAKDFAGGTVEGSFHTQACNDKFCLAPATVKFQVPVTVSAQASKHDAATGQNDKPADKPKSDASAKSPTSQESPSTPTADSDPGAPVTPDLGPVRELSGDQQKPTKQTDIERKINERGLFLTLLGIFGTGLLLSFTPCVYPLIPITISYFGGQGEGRVSRTLLMAAVYVIGIAITFSTLGVIAATTGGIFGAALQHPITLIVIAGVMVALSLSMFGVYEFNLPSGFNRVLNKSVESTSGILGALIMGLLMGFIAAPCIGPFVLGLLTYVSNVGSASRGFLFFFVLAMGLGLPYLFLGAFSGAAKSLPRSGEWMIKVRKLFGLILLGMALYFLMPVLGKYVNMVRVIGVYIIVAAGVLVFDSFRSKPVWFNWALRGVAGFAVVVGLYILWPSPVPPSIDWKSFDTTLLASAKAEGRPVVIDFSADWCVPCHELDRETFIDPKVRAESSRFVAMKADLTNPPTGELAKFVQESQIPGAPTVLFIDSKGNLLNDPRITGFVRPQEFLNQMQQVH